MFALNTSPEMPIPYYHLPDNAYDAARDSIVNLGFSQEAILEDYSFSTKEEQLVKTNALAFAHPLHRTLKDYAGFTLYNAMNGLDNERIVQVLAQTAALFHLIHRNDSFSFWASGIQDNQVKPIHIASNIDYTQLGRVLNNYAVDLKPQKIVDVKQGRAQFTHPSFADAGLQPLQLSLWAVNVTRPLLVKYFGQAVNVLRDRLKNDENTVVDLATQLLGATILADTGVLGDGVRNEQNLSLNKMIQAAQSRFPNYFKEKLFDNHFDIAQQAYQILRQIRYVSFAPEMLTEIYRQAYDEKRRKELGRFDTPLYLTQRIWENIPVEFLPPDQRITVDMTCGWGSFLLAGYKRLSNLSDMQGLSLRQYLYGNDRESLDAKLAGLGLLISTSEDSWHVDYGDAIEWSWLNRNRPNLIVGNPPFGADRKTIKGRQNRYQEADKYLDHALKRLADGGYLAIVMPQSFVAAKSAPSLRKTLLEKCDIQELWDLPLGTFDAATNTVVIFAHKRVEMPTRSSFPARVRTLQQSTKKKFEEIGIFTASSIVSDQSSWIEAPSNIIDYQQILPESMWKDIHSRCGQLEEKAFIAMGAVVGQNSERKRWKDYESPQTVPWLSGSNTLPTPFLIDYSQASTIIYPNDLVEPGKYKRHPNDPTKGKEHFFIGQKVLLISDPNPSWGKRVKVAIERRGGYYISNTFFMIKPRYNLQDSPITNEVIAAVLDWYVSNAWIVEHLKYPWVEKRIIQKMPFPSNLTKIECEILSDAVQKIEDAIKIGLARPIDATQSIDTILKTAYQLDDETFERLRLIYEWDDNPQITLDTQSDPDAQWEISGMVEAVNASAGEMTLWLSGFDHFETVPITPVMPGWMLRPQAAFRTTIPRFCVQQRSLANVSWGKFYPQEYTYLAEEELFDQLTRSFYPETEIT